MKKALFLALFIQSIFITTIKSQNDVILYRDYRLFMIYTRDSIMRELISTQLCDFSNYCELEYNKNLSPRLKWDIKFNFNHEEIVDILTNMGNYGYYNFLEKIGDDYFVISRHLNYRYNRDDKDSVNISLDLKNKKQNLADLNYVRFGLNNKCNNVIKNENIESLLSDKQIKAYNDWKIKIGLLNAKKMTKNKIIL